MCKAYLRDNKVAVKGGKHETFKSVGGFIAFNTSLNITASAQDMPDISLLNKLGITDGDISEKEKYHKSGICRNDRAFYEHKRARSA